MFFKDSPLPFFSLTQHRAVQRCFLVVTLVALIILTPCAASAQIDAKQIISVLKNWFSPSTTIVDVGADGQNRKITISGGLVVKPVTLVVSQTANNFEGTIPDEVKLDAILGLADIPLLNKFGAKNLKFSVPITNANDYAVFDGDFTLCGKSLFCHGLAIVSFDKKEAILFTRTPKDHAKLGDLWGKLDNFFIPVKDIPLPPGMTILSSIAFETKIKDFPERTHSFFKDGGEVLDFDQPLKVSQPGLSAMCRFDPADIHPVLKKIRGLIGMGTDSSWFSIEVGAEGLVITGHLPQGTAPTWLPSFLIPHWTDGSRVSMSIRISTSIECTDHTDMNIAIPGSPLKMTWDCIARLSGSGVGIELKGGVEGMWHDVLGVKGLSLGNGSISGGINTTFVDGNLIAGMAGSIGIKDKLYDMGIKATFEIIEDQMLPRALTFRYECDKIGIGSLVDLLEVFVKGFIAHPFYEKLNKAEMDAMVAATGGSDKEKKELEGIVKAAYDALRGDHSLTDTLGLNSLPAFELRDVLVYIDLPRILLPGKEDPADADTPAKTSAMKAFYKNSKNKLGKAGSLLAKTKTLGSGAALAGTLVLFDRELGSIDFEFTILGGIKIFGEIKPIDLGVINIKSCKIDIGCGFKCLPHFIINGDVTFFGGERKVDVEFSKDRIYFEDLVDLAELWKTQLKMEVVKLHDGAITPKNIKNVKVHGEMHEDAQDWFKHQVTDNLEEACKSMSAHLEEVKATVPELKKNVANLSEKVEELRVKFKGAVNKIEPAIEAAKSYVDNLQKQIDQAQHDFDNTSKYRIDKRSYYKGKKYTLIAIKESADQALDILLKANKDFLVPFEQWSEAVPVVGAFQEANHLLDFAERTITCGEKTLAKTRELINDIGKKVGSVPFKIDNISFDADFPKTDSPDPVLMKIKANFGGHKYDGSAKIFPLLAAIKKESEDIKKKLSDNAKAVGDLAKSMANGVFAMVNHDVKTEYINANSPQGKGTNFVKIAKQMGIKWRALDAEQKLMEDEIKSNSWD